MGTDISNHPLLNPNIEMTHWQTCVKQAIIGVMSRWAPYKLDGSGGATRTVYWKGPKDSRKAAILTAKDPVHTYCNGICQEVWQTAFLAWMEGYEDQLPSIAQMKEMRSYFGVWDKDHPGSAQGLLWLADQPPCNEYLTVTDYTDDILNAPFGSFCQMQFSRRGPEDGHSVIILGSGKYKGKDVVHVFSSNNYYDKNWEFSRDQQPGPGFDFYYVSVTRDGFQRIFHAAYIEDDE